MAWPLGAGEGSVIGSKWRAQGPLGSLVLSAAADQHRLMTGAERKRLHERHQARPALPSKPGQQGLARLKAEAACWLYGILYKLCLINVTCMHNDRRVHCSAAVSLCARARKER